jgi:hypothetical protein
MPSPFPGMDPYGRPGLVPDLHDGMIFSIKEAFQVRLPGRTMPGPPARLARPATSVAGRGQMSMCSDPGVGRSEGRA